MELVDFLRARLDEDEAAAKAATPGPWSVNDESYAETIYAPDGTAVVGGGRWGGEASVFESTDDAIHIARHDPARVLAEVESKRRTLDDVVPQIDGMEDRIDGEWGAGDPTERESVTLLRLLARPFRAHPDFDPAWLED